MDNDQVADLFELVADLKELLAENRFRVAAYRRAAEAVRGCPWPVVGMSLEQLEAVSGIGEALAEKIVELGQTGSIAAVEELRAQVPPGLPVLLRIPGLGPKKLARIWQELGVTNADELRGVLSDGRLAGLKGFGEKTAEKILQGLAFAEQSEQRTPLGVAWPLAEEVERFLSGLAGVKRVASAGSLRRRRETIGDLDFLAEAPGAAGEGGVGGDAAVGRAVCKAFSGMKGVESVLASGDAKASVLVAGSGFRIQMDLRVVPPESFGSALQYFTGSQQHNIRLRERAVARGWKLNEWGLFDADGRRLAGASEEEIYQQLGLICPPPELREDRGEFALEERPDLIELGDLRGDLHMHTTASDGRGTLEEMIEAARLLGHEYICITDHSTSSFIANGLDASRMEEQIRLVRRAAESVAGIRVLVGSEVDIRSDGTLDYPDSLLAELDFVVASVHQGLDGAEEKLTRRVLRAIENPYVCVIGHPTGRLINQRPPMKLDLAKVFRFAADTGTALEINSAWQRLDLSDVNIRAARDAGCRFCINTDAHAPGGLGNLRFGVATARRGGLTAGDVLNTRSVDDMLWLARAKRRQMLSG